MHDLDLVLYNGSCDSEARIALSFVMVAVKSVLFATFDLGDIGKSNEIAPSANAK